ncbi:hypothetical protein GQL56_09890 [Pseudomonas putida]|nr:hypothetical protein [Pseudomonas putida]
MTVNKIGRLTNLHGMMTDEYGEFRLDKSRRSDKQVESFVYNAAVVERFRELLKAWRRPQKSPEWGFSAIAKDQAGSATPPANVENTAANSGLAIGFLISKLNVSGFFAE